MIYKPLKLPTMEQTLQLWRGMAEEAGLGGLHIVASSTDVREDLVSAGCDAVMRGPDFKLRGWARGWRDPMARVRQSVNARRGRPQIFDFAGMALRVSGPA